MHDNLAPAALAIVRVKAPWWAPSTLIVRKLVASVPEYSRVPGLHQKAYILTADHQLGGVYWFADRSAAEAWFSPAWHARVEKLRGAPGDVRILDILETRAGDTPDPSASAPGGAARVDAMVTWGGGTLPAAGSGLVRAVRVATAPAVVALWASRASAHAFLARSGADPAGASFRVPLLLDTAAAQRPARVAVTG